MKRDYYEILGVPKDATAQQIKKVYRSLALKHHPDRVEQSKKKESEEKFKEISEAYGVLSDQQKRQMYDQYGHAGIDQRFTREDIFRGADFSGFGDFGDIFSQFFGGGGGGFDFFGGGGGRSRSQRGRDIQYEVAITLAEAYSGVKKKINVPRYEHCSKCQGSGAKPGSPMKTCPTCRGQGRVVVSMGGLFQMQQTCSDCRGQGKTITEYCPDCHGKGKVKVTRSIEVAIPAGVDNDTRLRVRGEGEVGSGGPGDLYVYIMVKPHKTFERQGLDLSMQLPISYLIASLGGEVAVPTLDGHVTMKIPSGTQSGKIFRLRAKGMPSVRGGGQGDLFAKVMIQVPTRLTVKQKELLGELARLAGQDVPKPGETFAEKIKSVFK